MSRRFVGRTITALILVVVVLGLVSGWYRTTRPSYRFEQGRRALERGDLLEADQLADLLQAAGADDYWRLLKAEMAMKRTAPREALAFVTAIEDEGELRIRATAVAAEALIALRRPQEAEQALLYVLSRDPDHVNAHRWLAAIYYDQGVLPRAGEHLEHVTRLDPSDARPWRLMGLISRDMDDVDGAVNAYQESLKRDPHPADEDELRVELAECLLKQSRYEEALETLRPLTTAAAAAVAAEAFVALGRDADAIDRLDQGLKLAPNNASLLRQRAERHLAMGEAAEAARLLERVVEQVPYEFRSRTQLARAYELLNRPDEAKAQQAEVQRTIQLVEQVHKKNQEAMRNPWDAGVREELAQLCEEMRRPELARMWRKAAEASRAANR